MSKTPQKPQTQSSQKTRVNNAVKNQAREHQRAHPGTGYAAARAAVLTTIAPDPWATIIGQDDAKRHLRLIAARKPNPLHAVVLGPVGCGKTHVAETLHTVLRGNTSKFISVGHGNVIGMTVGSTAVLTRRVLDDLNGGTLTFSVEESMGRVFPDPFFDEFYDVLAAEMSSRDVSLILTARGEKEMRQFARTSRATQFLADQCTDNTVTLQAPDSGMCSQFVTDLVDQHQINLSADAAIALRAIFDNTAAERIVGGYRVWRRVVESAEYQRDLRLFGDGTPTGTYSADELTTITVEDIARAWNLISIELTIPEQ